jgi:hypothetical protein
MDRFRDRLRAQVKVKVKVTNVSVDEVNKVNVNKKTRKPLPKIKTPSKMSCSRTNTSTRAKVVDDKIFASGTFKNVWKGVYTDGVRRGESCVAKEFKAGSVYKDHYFQEELNIVARAHIIIDHFAAAKVISNGRIYLNSPEIWTYDDTNEKCLTEPMIENFEKFNSNTGWAPIAGTAWVEAMQALSHFSYHDSNGQFLL